eukprot:jgi/Tetstr1/422902/TSEL_013685.t1
MYPEPHPSGEALLTKLIQFAEDNEAALLSGQTTLRLSPRAVEYVAGRLAGLEELHRLKSAAPVEFLRGCVSNLGDFKRLERITFLRRLTSLTITPFSGTRRDPTPLQLSVFSSLTSLELRSCDLVFCAPAGLDALRPRLVSLRVLNSLEVLSHLLAPENDGRLPQGSTPLAGAATWPALERLSCPGNALGAMDASLALLPRLATLDLGRNHISSVSHLTPATALSTLRLRGNGITDCRPLANCPSLTDVDLSWNGIASLDGLQRLPALARLDLRGNRLAQLSEVATIGALPALGELLVQRNPLSCVLSWRPGVLACFPDTFFSLVLDGEKASRQELRKVLSVLSRRTARGATGAAGAGPRPFPRAQLGSSSIGSPESSLDEAAACPSPIRVEAGGKAAKASRARVVDFDAAGGVVPSPQAPQASGAARRGESPGRGGSAGRAGAGARQRGKAFVPLPPASVKAAAWEQMQAFVEGQAVGAIPLEDEPPLGNSPSGGRPRPPRHRAHRVGSPPRYDQGVVQRLRASSRGHSIADDASEETDTGCSSSDTDDGGEEVAGWRLPSSALPA